MKPSMALRLFEPVSFSPRAGTMWTSVLPAHAPRGLQGGPEKVPPQESHLGRGAQQERHVQPTEEAVSCSSSNCLWHTLPPPPPNRLQTPLRARGLAPPTRKYLLGFYKVPNVSFYYSKVSYLCKYKEGKDDERWTWSGLWGAVNRFQSEALWSFLKTTWTYLPVLPF